MAETDRELVARWWNEAWKDGVWAASWEKSLDGLTPAQAAWQPGPGRKSIWQHVLHMCFWRENWLRRSATDPLGPGPTKEALAAGNFPEVGDRSPEAWQAARKRLEVTQQGIAAAFADPSRRVAELFYFLPHDCYHFGQVNALRAMQGLPPIE